MSALKGVDCNDLQGKEEDKKPKYLGHAHNIYYLFYIYWKLVKIESITKLSNFNFYWTKIFDQNDSNHIAFLFTFSRAINPKVPWVTKMNILLTMSNKEEMLHELINWSGDRKCFDRVCTVLKSPWILGEVLEKSLNFCASLWKALNFLQLWR